MAGWSERITIPGTTRVTFRADPSKMPAAVLAAIESSWTWTKCEDGFYYHNSGPFEGATKICEEVRGGGVPKPVDERLASFVSIYDPEPGPNSLKYIWRQARKTYVDDKLPEGLTRAGATRITDILRPYLGGAASGARFFRLQRRETPFGGTEQNDGIYARVLILLSTAKTIVHYLDYPAGETSDEHLDDLARAWQQQVVYQEPTAYPKDAIPVPGHDAETLAMIEAAQAA